MTADGHQKPRREGSPPTWIGSTPSQEPSSSSDSQTSIPSKIQQINELQRQQIQQHGGPEGYIRELAPRLLHLFPGPWTPELVEADTTAAWVSADQRLAQCAKCPPHGGACEGSISTFPEGTIVAFAGHALGSSPCGKWQTWIERRRLLHVGIPEALLEWPLERLLCTGGRYPARERLRSWLELAKEGGKPPSFLMTGAAPATRTRLAAAIAREVTRGKSSVHYTFAPRLAAEMKDHFDRDRSERDESPIERCEQAEVLVFDFVDPVPKNRDAWAPWFLSRIDSMLWKRLSASMPTVLVSRASRTELWRHFECASVFTIDEVDVASLAFGPVSDL